MSPVSEFTTFFSPSSSLYSSHDSLFHTIFTFCLKKRGEKVIRSGGFFFLSSFLPKSQQRRRRDVSQCVCGYLTTLNPPLFKETLDIFLQVEFPRITRTFLPLLLYECVVMPQKFFQHTTTTSDDVLRGHKTCNFVFLSLLLFNFTWTRHDTPRHTH